MKTHGKAVVVSLAIGIVGLPALAAGAGKATFKEFTVKKTTRAADDAHKETIEIVSWSLGATSASSANTYRGTTNVNEGVLTLNATSVPASVTRLCQSQAKVSSMTVESDGQRHEFRDVVFRQCPAGGGGTFTLSFSGQTTAVPHANASMRELPNVTIAGLTPSASQNNLKQITLATNKATLYVGTANGGVWKLSDGGATWTRGQQSPLVVIEGKAGTKLSFSKVSLEEVVLTTMPPSAGAAASEVQKITFTFESTMATRQLIDAIVAGR